MPTFKLVLAYDGAELVGWQRQASGTSVQALLEDALAALVGHEVTVVGAGRTDAGVHALGQVASFTVERPLAADTVLRAVNARLPPSVRIVEATEVDGAFHARFGARSKVYRYRIWNGEVLSPFERRYAWHLPGALDVDRMAAAARVVVGRHDFAAFRAAGTMTKTTERVIFSARLQAQEVPGSGGARLVTCEIVGDGFLRHMVRNIVGTLVEIGRGRRPVEWMATVLESRDRQEAGPTAPAEGLILVSVAYGGAAAAALAAER